MADDRSPDGRQRLLQAALNHLATSSEAELRVTDIAAEADVAIGLIRHHFGSRDGLVTEAQRVRLEGAVKDDLAAAQSFVGLARTTEDMLAGIRSLTIELLNPGRGALRLSRVAVIGSAHGRPELRDEFATTVSELVDRLSAIIADAQRSGLIRLDLEPRAIATFIQAYALGMILHDLDPDAPEPLAMVAVIMTAVRSLLVDPLEPRGASTQS